VQAGADYDEINTEYHLSIARASQNTALFYCLASCIDTYRETRAHIDRIASVAADDLFDSPLGPVLITEVVSHEHDIRAALNRPGARDDTAVRAALTRPLQEIDKRIKEGGLPAVRIVLEHGPRILGEGEPVITLTVSSFELLRAVSGRRSRKQIRALDWNGDPGPWLGSLALFGEREDDLDE
jgi:hypothetical protein